MSINSLSSIGYMPSGGMDPAGLYGTLEYETKKTEDMANAVYDAAKKDDEELLSACKDFESYFIQIMFREMRKTVLEDQDGVFGKSSATLTFQDMLDEQVSIQSASQGGIGLAAFMYKQMKQSGQNISQTL